MDNLRRTDLRNSLEYELAFETQRKSLGPKARVEWLLKMLTEYVERWIGFCQPPTAGMQTLVQDSGFAMMEIGAGLLTRELRGVDPPANVVSAWLGFLSSLGELRDRADYRLIEDVERAMKETQDSIADWVTPSA